MAPIHRAAYKGDEGEVSRLVAEDGRRLNAPIQARVYKGGYSLEGCTPLMLAANKGHDTVVARLIKLGADVGLSDAGGRQATHRACTPSMGCQCASRWGCCSTLALAADAGSRLGCDRLREGVAGSGRRHCTWMHRIAWAGQPYIRQPAGAIPR